MRKSFGTSVVAISAAAMLALAGCGSGRSEESGGSNGDAKGFAANSLIGVALPAKTSENWVLAGDLFSNGLKEAGFQADVQYAGASTTVADQQAQITAMVTKGAKVIVIGATDAAQLSTQVAAAHQAGVKVIAYDRLITNTPDLDYYVAFDNFKVGQLQGQALLEGMKAKKPNGPYNIELFSGSPDDNNAGVFFNGAMDVLKPEIDKGNVVVASKQTDVKQTAIQGWKAEGAQARMDQLLTSTYGNKELDGVLSPNDTLARAILTSVKGAGKPVPVVTGQDSEVESVKSIVAGEQYMTINKDTRNLVKETINMVKALQAGDKPQVNDTSSYNNGSKVVETYLLPPVAVTKANAAEAYANDPKLAPLTK
ncbi:substrate-binding domain-containing protein [Micromonospora profundi]|uniref:Sugar ABC transporter substrate-binding protein n=1 Tax=Micromonospora profundi TaxID=1420889 RepID=A0AAJ6HS87_9ACTN|nr:MULTISPECIES: sugar-binding protein [Micromonospora]KOX12283.1 sugar ABC transporter substrate-binding protein [Micromonospora sp. NRRL B-16802]NJC13654.1 putative multiple sugar transport system substrate-binding protein [Micromonospora profundi]WLS45237.1 sugar ABC transporter substrate-binding protein [Micromonospora profundi]